MCRCTFNFLHLQCTFCTFSPHSPCSPVHHTSHILSPKNAHQPLCLPNGNAHPGNDSVLLTLFACKFLGYWGWQDNAMESKVLKFVKQQVMWTHCDILTLCAKLVLKQTQNIWLEWNPYFSTWIISGYGKILTSGMKFFTDYERWKECWVYGFH